VLEARNLYKSFGGVAAVRGVDLTVGHGELMCIIGPNGAGKSSLLNLLCGVMRMDSGEIRFEGRDISRLPIYKFPRIGIARKFQAPAVFTDLSVRENLRVSGDAVGISYREDEIDEHLERIGLLQEAEMPAGSLAHGKKQWLEFGLCFVIRPKLLLLDEPTAGMTAEETVSTAALLKSLRRDMAAVVIEHDMSFVRELSTRTCVMHQGEIVRDGAFNDIEGDSFVQEIYLGKE
jgi:ABC-type uncharacterized transport system ATPase subunit